MIQIGCVCWQTVIILMKDLDGNDVLSYPLYVYNINEELIGQAFNKEDYIQIWNSDYKNNDIGELGGFYGPFTFSLKLRQDKQQPDYVIGDNDGGVPESALLDTDGSPLEDTDGTFLTDL